MFSWWLLLALFFSGSLMSQDRYDDYDLIDITWEKDSTNWKVVYDEQLHTEKWDSLPQMRFWRKIMNALPETSFINIASSREILDSIPTRIYGDLSYREKEAYKDSILEARNLPLGTRIYITTGKGDYYDHESVLPDIDKAAQIFVANSVDPWYAQAILLIESPGKLRKSYVGAYGPFQLMRYVAVSNGLTVSRELDERADIEKSAAATARFLRRVCLPETRKILAAWRLDYDESSIWFRLMVLHVYHAGAGNVRGLIRKIAPREVGQSLIRKVWATQYRGFRNASQNYSQLALSALLELDQIIKNKQEENKLPLPELTPIPVPQRTKIPYTNPIVPKVNFSRHP